MAISEKTRAKKSSSMKRYWAEKKKVKKSTTTKSTKKMSWRSFIKGKMGKYMKSEGSHGAAMRRLSKEWKKVNNN